MSSWESLKVIGDYIIVQIPLSSSLLW